MRFCSLSTASFPVRLKTSPSKAPVALKAQHDPQCPWVRWGQRESHGIAPKPPGERCRAPHLVLLSSNSAAELPCQTHGNCCSGLPRGFF